MKRLSLVALLGLVACVHGNDEAATRHAAPAVTLTTARVSRFVETVPATGRFGVPSGSQVRLGFAEQGMLKAVDVKLGDRVDRGDVLAELDATRLALSAADASAQARAATAAERQARVDRTSAKIRLDEDALHRAQSLYAAGVAPRKDIEAAAAQLADDRAQAAVANAGVASSVAEAQSAQARSALAQRDVAQTTLRAPTAGVVVAVLRRAGESVDPSAPVVVLAPSDHGDLTLLVTSTDLSRVRDGNVVRYTLVGSGVRGTGTVTGIAPVLDPEAQAGNVAVRVPRSGVPDGAMAEAEIEVEALEGIVLPDEAIVADPETSKTYVFVERTQRDGSTRFEQREVRVRDRRAGSVLLAGGVGPGERVATQGAFALLAPAGD